MPPYDDKMKKWCDPRPLQSEVCPSKNGKSSQAFDSPRAFVGNDEMGMTININITNNDNERLCRHRLYNDNVIDLWMCW